MTERLTTYYAIARTADGRHMHINEGIRPDPADQVDALAGHVVVIVPQEVDQATLELALRTLLLLIHDPDAGETLE